MEALLIIPAIFVAIYIYFLPSFIASEKKGTDWIFILNLFFGCTGIVWLVLLVWAITAEKE
jgi:hypothetical protein